MLENEFIELLFKAGADVSVIGDYEDKVFFVNFRCLKSPKLIKFSFSSPDGVKIIGDYIENILSDVMYDDIRVEQLQAFIDIGANVNVRNDIGETPLMQIVSSRVNFNIPEIVRLLLDAGADINAQDKYGWTPLMHAVSVFYPETAVVKLIVDAGADVNAICIEHDELNNESYVDVLMLAVKYCENPEIIQFLLDKGAKIDTDYNYGSIVCDSTLKYAARYNDEPRVIKILLKAGVNVKYDGWAALMLAIKYNTNPEILRVLIDFGVDVNQFSSYGETALLYSIKLFLSAGEERSMDFDMIIRTLIECGADIDVKDKFGKTDFMKAIVNDDLILAKKLLEYGAYIDNKDNDGKTVLMQMVEHPNDEKSLNVINFLIDAGASVNIQDNNGSTALMLAAQNSHNLDILKILLSHTLDINVHDKIGQTALMYAAKSNKNPEIIEFLLRAGADIALKDKDGNTAEYYAKLNVNPSIIRKLQYSYGGIVNWDILSECSLEDTTFTIFNSNESVASQIERLISEFNIEYVAIACGYCFYSGLSLLEHTIKRTLYSNVPFDLYIGTLQEYNKMSSNNIITGIDKHTVKVLNDFLGQENFSLYTCINRFYHGKLYFFEGSDKAVICIGSSNVSKSAFISNYELNIAFKTRINSSLHIKFKSWLEQLKGCSTEIYHLEESMFVDNELKQDNHPMMRNISKVTMENKINELTNEEVQYRLNLWMSYNPDIIAENIGIIALPNYFMFIYKEKKLIVLESLEAGNSYFCLNFEDSFENTINDISNFSKTEIFAYSNMNKRGYHITNKTSLESTIKSFFYETKKNNKKLVYQGATCEYVKLNESIEFFCVRCGKRKISKNYAKLMIDGEDKKLCNACYGALLAKSD